MLDGRPSYCINIVRDISPNCDCHPENDVPIVPDVGMFASADPVALDLACAEAINRQPVLPNSAITDLKHEHDCDRFHAAHDNTHWQDLIEHGKKLGIGQDTYELVPIRCIAHQPPGRHLPSRGFNMSSLPLPSFRRIRTTLQVLSTRLICHNHSKATAIKFVVS